MNSYSTGTVSGSSSIGGLIGGIVVGGYASNSFWDTSTSLIEISADGTGLPTEQMQDIDTFLNAGWDFVGESTNGTDDIWRMPNSNYPLLAWQITISPPVANANGPYSIFVGDTLTLDASGSKDDGNDIVSYVWDLDDNGSFETDAGSQEIFNVDYTYLQSLGLLVNNTYTIHLKVTDNDGQSDVNDSTLTIIPQPVDVDIKPGSCPNPLNVKSKGVLPVAVLGSEDFDVNSVDIASIRLVGVAPIRSGFEDVGTPLVDANECECFTEGPDGFPDLILKFETQRIVEAIGEVDHGDELILELTGVLSDETPIEGSDCVIIRGRHKPINKADFNGDGTVDMADFAAFTQNWLQ